MTCRVKGCEKPGIWKPVIVLRAPLDYKVPPVKGAIEMPLCDEHKNMVGLGDVMGEEGWNQICAQFKEAGLLEPEKALTTLDFERI